MLVNNSQRITTTRSFCKDCTRTFSTKYRCSSSFSGIFVIFLKDTRLVLQNDRFNPEPKSFNGDQFCIIAPTPTTIYSRSRSAGAFVGLRCGPSGHGVRTRGTGTICSIFMGQFTNLTFSNLVNVNYPCCNDNLSQESEFEDEEESDEDEAMQFVPCMVYDGRVHLFKHEPCRVCYSFGWNVCGFSTDRRLATGKGSHMIPRA